MDFLSMLAKRRSIRKYKKEYIFEEDLEKIVKAGLLSPSGRNRKPWEFIIVNDKDLLKKMAKTREHGAAMLEGAQAAIVVFGDPNKTDVWVEDCSIAMSNMHLMAHSMGLGSCWIQGRLRKAADGKTTEEHMLELLGVPDMFRLEAILAIGVPDETKEEHRLEELDMDDKVHWNVFTAFH